MLSTPAYAAASARSPLAPFTIQRREPGPHELLIDILYCGVCHSDIHQARDEWGGAIFPMVPGHEIVGKVARLGDRVKRWKEGDPVGVGVLVDSCRECESCKSGEEQYCERSASFTYNGLEQDGRTPTYGGYSTRITVDEGYVFRMPVGVPLERAAPLLCAGITTYSPLKHFGVKRGDSIAVVGLGGLGHIGVKFAKAMGCDVTVISHSEKKKDDAMRLGATSFISSRDADAFEKNTMKFDYILDTVSAVHDYNSYLELLRTDGTMMLVGLPDPTVVRPESLINRRRRLVGSMVGGLREVQEMLDFSAKNHIGADVELTRIQDINGAFERTVSGDVRYRFVIDMASLRDEPIGR